MPNKILPAIQQRLRADAESICFKCFHRKVCRAIDNQPCIECNQFTDANGVTVQQWISVSEQPEEHDSIWAKLYGTKSWQPGLFRKCSYDVLACVEKKDGSRRVISIRTYDGKWDNNKLNEETVIYWQSMPQPPKGE